MAFGTSGSMFTSSPWIEGLVAATATYGYGLSMQRGILDEVRIAMVSDFNRLLIERSMVDPEWMQALCDASIESSPFQRTFRAPGERP